MVGMAKTHKRLFLLFFFFIVVVLPISYVPLVNAGEVVNLSEDEEEYNASFFNIKKSSIKFNNISMDTTKWVLHDPNLPSNDLVVVTGDPYNATIINTGVKQQVLNVVNEQTGQVSSKLYCIYEWQIWYYYDIVLYTLAKDDVIQGVRNDKHDWLYHSGYGLNPWKWGKTDKSDEAKWAESLGYETGAGWSGVTQHDEMFFENYDLTTWYNQSQKITSDLSRWAWDGALSYEITLEPWYIFPGKMTVRGGDWVYDDFYAGVISTQAVRITGDKAERFNVYIDKDMIPLLSDDYASIQQDDGTGVSPVGYSAGEGVEGCMDAYYIRFDPLKGSEILEWKAVAPPNGTAAIMHAVATNNPTTVPGHFDTTALSMLNQQRRVRCTFPGIWMRPEVTIVGGEHLYKQFYHYEGLLGKFNGIGTLVPGVSLIIPGATDYPRNGKTPVIIDWYVKNVAERWEMRTGVRIMTLYEWSGASSQNTPMGLPLTFPNFNSGDRLIHAGTEGPLGVKAPPSFLEQYWWLFVLIGAVAVVYLVYKMKGGGKAQAEVKLTQYIGSLPPSKEG